MKKIIFWGGVAVFVLGFLANFLAGATNGPSPETQKPIVPFLYGTNQTMWMFLAFAGIIVAVVGIFLKGKKKK